MTTLLNRVKNAAATATSLTRSSSPTQPGQRAGLSATVKRHLYVNTVMSVSVVLGTVGVVAPTAVYYMGGERENERTGRLERWKSEWQQSGEEKRRQRILKEIGDTKDERLSALRTQLQTSGKYTAPQ